MMVAAGALATVAFTAPPAPASTVTETTIPTANSAPIGIAAGPDGALWFTERNANQIARITTAPTPTVTETTIPTAGSGPFGIAAGPDGALWFTEPGANRIGRITTTGTVTETTIPTGSEPVGIAAGPDGALWFTESGASKIGRITTPDVSAGGTGGGGTQPPGMTSASDTSAPSVSGYRLTNNPFVAASRSTPTSGSAAKAKQHKQGTTFRYTLSEAATVKIAIAQRRAGRRKGKRCVAPTRKLRHARRCTRLTTRGTLTRVSRQGANTVAFSGRIGSKALGPGGYQATLTATDDAKNTSRAQTINFQVVKR